MRIFNDSHFFITIFQITKIESGSKMKTNTKSIDLTQAVEFNGKVYKLKINNKFATLIDIIGNKVEYASFIPFAKNTSVHSYNTARNKFYREHIIIVKKNDTFYTTNNEPLDFYSDLDDLLNNTEAGSIFSTIKIKDIFEDGTEYAVGIHIDEIVLASRKVSENPGFIIDITYDFEYRGAKQTKLYNVKSFSQHKE